MHDRFQEEEEAARHRYLNTHQAAEYMGLRPQTLYNWRFRGIGPAYTVISGRAIRYDLRDLHAFMATRRVVPRQESDQ